MKQFSEFENRQGGIAIRFLASEQDDQEYIYLKINDGVYVDQLFSVSFFNITHTTFNPKTSSLSYIGISNFSLVNHFGNDFTFKTCDILTQIDLTNWKTNLPWNLTYEWLDVIIFLV